MGCKQPSNKLALRKLSGECGRIFSFRVLEALPVLLAASGLRCAGNRLVRGPSSEARSCAPPTLWASAPSLGLFHVKGTVRKTISFPQQSLWEVPTLRGLWPSRCPKFSTDSHVNLTCPLHTEGPGERRSWAPAPSFPAQGWISPLAVRESSLGS